MEAVLMICIGVAIGGTAVYFAAPKPVAAAPAKVVTLGEVTDLIERLSPFARDPSREYGGVTVTITGVSAKVSLETIDYKTVSGGGRTLKEAVSVLQDSDRLKPALAGWGERR